MAVSARKRAVFLDRDGTLIHECHYLSEPDRVELYPNSIEAIKLLQDAGFKTVLLTNQSGVARGMFPEEAITAVHRRLEELLARSGVALDGVYYCPHHPEGTIAGYTTICDCRKPRPGLVLRAAADLELDLVGSWVIGDKKADLLLGRELGLRSMLVRTGYGARVEEASGNLAHGIADDILGAAQHILQDSGECM
ncbi:MAG: HAD-IIIA family hydrolase [bacterium]|nr:HAD-IIIA family hydrolase [bacterium]